MWIWSDLEPSRSPVRSRPTTYYLAYRRSAYSKVLILWAISSVAGVVLWEFVSPMDNLTMDSSQSQVESTMPSTLHEVENVSLDLTLSRLQKLTVRLAHTGTVPAWAASKDYQDSRNSSEATKIHRRMAAGQYFAGEQRWEGEILRCLNLYREAQLRLVSRLYSCDFVLYWGVD
jgi:hypothetical protein